MDIYDVLTMLESSPEAFGAFSDICYTLTYGVPFPGQLEAHLYYKENNQ